MILATLSIDSEFVNHYLRIRSAFIVTLCQLCLNITLFTVNNSFFMKNNPIRSLTQKYYSRLLLMTVFSVASIGTLSACQKEPEPVDAPTAAPTTAPTDVAAQNAPVAPIAVIDNNDAPAQITESEVQAEREINLADIENDNSAPNTDSADDSNSSEQTIKGTQITNVKYQNDTGDIISVVFETSETDVLRAILNLPNNNKMTLSATEGQGNNPIYRSTDGNTELISHGGGSTIDLLQNGDITSFEAISAEAEVITQP